MTNQKIRNKRKYLIHKITKNITLENDIIVVETLKVKDMIENNASKLSKFIASSSLSEIIRQLKYKCEWKGKKFYQIDCYYASSQICNRCGYKESKVKDLSIRFLCHEIQHHTCISFKRLSFSFKRLSFSFFGTGI